MHNIVDIMNKQGGTHIFLFLNVNCTLQFVCYLISNFIVHHGSSTSFPSGAWEPAY